MKKFVALLMILTLCFSFSYVYAEQSEDIESGVYTENIEVVTPTPEPTPEPTPIPRGDWDVYISSSLEGKEQVMVGTTVTLTANLSGFREGIDEYSIEWYVNKGDNWENVGGGETYSFDINEENVNYKYKVIVHVTW